VAIAIVVISSMSCNIIFVSRCGGFEGKPRHLDMISICVTMDCMVNFSGIQVFVNDMAALVFLNDFNFKVQSVFMNNIFIYEKILI
jgi:hypothetical protein